MVPGKEITTEYAPGEVVDVPQHDGTVLRQQGEFVLTDTGVEGSLVYAFSAPLREAIARHGQATLTLDLADVVQQAATPAKARVEPEIDQARVRKAISFGMDELTRPYDNFEILRIAVRILLRVSRGARDRMAWLRRMQKSPLRAEFERAATAIINRRRP